MNTVKRAGFTLVELAIVLVIIGLLVGGVLVGADLIKAATLRSTLTQIGNVETGVLTFRTKYNGFPGDLKNAVSYFTGMTDANNANGQGDGDSLIENVSAAATVCTGTRTCVSGESAVFGYQLYQAGYIKEALNIADPTNYTANPNTGMFVPLKLGHGALIAGAGNDSKNYFIIATPGTTAATAGAEDFTAGLNGQEASNIDDKIDDGDPTTGGIKSIAIATALAGNTTAAPVNGATSVTSECYDSNTTPPSYYAADETPRCNLQVRTSF